MSQSSEFTDICFMGYWGTDTHSWGYDPLDGDLSKTRAVDQSIVHAKMNSFEVVKPPHGQIDWGRPIHPDHVPTKIRVGGPRRKLADYIMWQGGWLVSEKFRQVVEKLEPGIHQFFPVEMRFKSSVLEEKYYIFIFCQHRAVISHEHSEAQLKVLFGPGDFRPLGKGEPLPAGALPGIWATDAVPKEKRARALVFDVSLRGGLHFWRDLSLAMNTLCSGEAAEAMTKVGITGASFQKLEIC